MKKVFNKNTIMVDKSGTATRQVTQMHAIVPQLTATTIEALFLPILVLPRMLLLRITIRLQNHHMRAASPQRTARLTKILFFGS